MRPLLSSFMLLALGGACLGSAQESPAPVSSATRSLERRINELYKPCGRCGGNPTVTYPGDPLELPRDWVIDVQSGSGHGGGLNALRLTGRASGAIAERLIWDRGPAITLIDAPPAAQAARRMVSATKLVDALRTLRLLPSAEIQPSSCRTRVDPGGTRWVCGGWLESGDFFVLVRVSGFDGTVLFEGEFAGYPSSSKQLSYVPVVAAMQAVRDAVKSETEWCAIPEQELRNTHFASAFALNRELLTRDSHGWVLTRSLEALAVFGHSGVLPALQELRETDGLADPARVGVLLEDPLHWLSGPPKLLKVR